MKKEIKVNFIIPDNVNLSELLNEAVMGIQLNMVKTILNKCETPEERNSVIDAIQARI